MNSGLHLGGWPWDGCLRCVDSEEAMGALQISEVIEADYSLSDSFNEDYVKFQRAYYGIKSVQ